MIHGTRRRGGWLWPAVFAAAAVLTLVTGRQLTAPPSAASEVPLVAHAARVPTPTTTPTTQARPASPKTAARPGPRWTTRSAAPPPVRAVAAPTRLVADAVNLDLPVQPTTVDSDGQLRLPDRPDRLGWYSYGSAPADRQGAVVIAGHLDSARYGTGPLTRAASLRTGDIIRMADAADHSRAYRVVAVERLAKSDLASAGLFDRSGPRVLRLITCGGAYDPDHGGYQDNLVVTAEPT